MNLDPRRMRFLLAVARTGGVLAAADELRVTPSAVSQQLKRLELEVGRELVRRTSRGVVLTPAGLAVAEAAQDLEEVLEQTISRLERTAEGPVGTVRVGAFQSAIRHVLAPRLVQWASEHPELHFDIVEGDQDRLLKQMRKGKLDMVLVESDEASQDHPPVAGTVELPLLDEPWRLVVPTGTLTGDVVDLTRLRLPWLGTQSSAASVEAMQRVHRTGRREMTVRHEYVDTGTAVALVAAGQGVTVLPSLALLGVEATGVDVLQIPGLGTRRIALRHPTRGQTDPHVLEAAIRLVRVAAAELDLETLTSGTPELAEYPAR